MTGPVAPGTLHVDPVDLLVLNGLVREGARSLVTRRRLTPREADILAVVATTAYAARVSAIASGQASAVAVTSGNVIPASANANGILSTEASVARSDPNELTVTEVADMIARSQQRVRQLVTDGTLPARRVGRTYLVDADAVTAYLLVRDSETTNVDR
jgi:excisionase family DNA binding protein